MAKHKLRRFSEMESFPNTIQAGRAFPPSDNGMRGKWQEDFFKNKNELILELGCGRGEYTVYLAEKFPNKNFIGVDIKGARLWRGAKTAMEKGFSNAGFLRIQIEHLLHFFGVHPAALATRPFGGRVGGLGRCRRREKRAGNCDYDAWHSGPP